MIKSNILFPNRKFVLSDYKKYSLLVIFWEIIFIIIFTYYVPREVALTRYNQLFVVYVSQVLNNVHSSNSALIINRDFYGKLFPLLLGFQIAVASFTGLSPRHLNLFPYGSILLPISIFYLLNSLKGSKKEISNRKLSFTEISLMMVLTIYAFNFQGMYGGYVASLAFPLLFFGLGLLYRIYEHQEYFWQNIVGFYIVIFLLLGIWHTASFIMLFIIIGVSLSHSIHVIIFKVKKQEVDSNSSLPELKISIAFWIQGIIFAILLFIIKYDLIIEYIHIYLNGSSSGITLVIEGLFSPIIRKIHGETDIPLSQPKYEYVYTTNLMGKIYFYAHFLYHLINFIGLISGILFLFRFFKNKNRIKKNENMLLIKVFAIGLIFAQILFSLAYIRTAVSFFIVIYLSPIITVIIFSKLNKRKINVIFIIGLLLTVSLITSTNIITDQQGQTPESVYSNDVRAFQWLFKNTENNSLYYVDFTIYGRLLEFYVNHYDNYKHHQFELQPILSKNYGILVGDINNTLIKYNVSTYIILDLKTMSIGKPIHIYEGRGLIISDLIKINNNERLVLIYNDSNIGIYKCIF